MWFIDGITAFSSSNSTPPSLDLIPCVAGDDSELQLEFQTRDLISRQNQRPRLFWLPSLPSPSSFYGDTYPNALSYCGHLPRAPNIRYMRLPSELLPRRKSAELRGLQSSGQTSKGFFGGMFSLAHPRCPRHRIDNLILRDLPKWSGASLERAMYFRIDDA